MAGVGPGGLILKGGKSKSIPTDYVGSVRVRGRTGDLILRHARPAGGDFLMELQLSIEPKAAWQRLVAVRLDKAIDDQDQTLKEAELPKPGPNGGGLGGPGGGIGGGGPRLVGLGGGFAPGPLSFVAGTDLFTALRLSPGVKKPKALKELKGTVTAEVSSPQPAITVDNLLKAKGKTFKADDGGSIKVVAINKADDGQIKLQFDLTGPVQAVPDGNGIAIGAPTGGGAVPPAAAQPPGIRFGGGGVMVGSARTALGYGLTLLDAKGTPITEVMQRLDLQVHDNQVTQRHDWTFKLAKGQEAVKLVLSSSRTVKIEVPFTLKNVPLP